MNQAASSLSFSFFPSLHSWHIIGCSEEPRASPPPIIGKKFLFSETVFSVSFSLEIEDKLLHLLQKNFNGHFGYEICKSQIIRWKRRV